MLLMPTNAPCACMRTRKAGAKLLLFPEIRKKKAKYFRWVLLIPTVVYNIIVGFDVLSSAQTLDDFAGLHLLTGRPADYLQKMGANQ